MKCLSVRQPWACAIVFGPKRIENRGWFPRTGARGGGAFRGALAIHASSVRKPDHAARLVLQETWPEWEAWEHNHPPVFGSVIGVARLIDAVDVRALSVQHAKLARQQRLFIAGPVCWVLDDVIPLSRPLPWCGRLGLFDVPDELITPLIQERAA